MATAHVVVQTPLQKGMPKQVCVLLTADETIILIHALSMAVNATALGTVYELGNELKTKLLETL